MAYSESTLSAVETLKDANYRVIGVEQVAKSTMLNECTFSSDEKLVLIFGNEVKGVQQNVLDVCDDFLEIPQSGTKHSLNISVSVGVVLWELTKKFSA